jgi:hypothetical protein
MAAALLFGALISATDPVAVAARTLLAEVDEAIEEVALGRPAGTGRGPARFRRMVERFVVALPDP